MREKYERLLKGFIFGTKIWVNVVSVAAAILTICQNLG